MQSHEVRLTIPPEVAARIPRYNPDRQGPDEDRMLYASFRDGQTGSAYYIGEYDGEDLCWGFIKVVNNVNQFGDFRLSDVSRFLDNMLMPMYFDTAFVPSTGLQLSQRIERLGHQGS